MNLSQSTVVSVANRPMFGVGGSNAYATHEYKGYQVSMEWDETDGEPVMLIWPALAWKESGVFGICLSSAGKYADPNGSPTKEGLYECGMALSLLGRAVLPIELNVLVDVVMRFIPDLILMPPAPRALRRAAKGQAYMDITQSDQYGRVISEVSI
jgi:hypothetical protein